MINSGGVNSGSYRTWTPIGTYSVILFGDNKSGYRGTFDGRGYTISGLYNNNDDSYVGLFGCIDTGGTVKNIGIVDSYFTGSYVGGITGYNNGGTITNVYNRGHIQANRYQGGICGYNKSGTISLCYSTGSVAKGSYSGAIVGRNGATVSNCYFLNGVASYGVGAFSSSGGSTTASVTDVKTAAQFASGEVAYLLQKMNTSLTWGQKSNTAGSLPVLTTNELYAVARFGNDDTGDLGYSVASLGDVNNDRNVDILDYQIIVDVALSDNNTEDSGYDRVLFVRGDVNGDSVVDVLDVQLIWNMYFGKNYTYIYAPGDFDGNGVVDSADNQKVKQYISNGYHLQKCEQFACDINSDTYQDDIDLFQGYGVSADKNYVFFDTKYGKHERNYMDVYIPKNKKVVGTLLYLHGGAWMGGDKSEFYGRLEEFAALGYAGISVNYRYINETTDLDDIMDDIQQAVALAKKMGDDLGVELSGFVSTGGSAGGHLSLHYAYSRADVSAIPPAAVVSYCGPTDLSDDYYFYNEELGCYNGLSPGGYDTTEQILSFACGRSFTYETRADAAAALQFVSPLYYVDENTVPTVINHGMVDDIVPFRNAQALEAKLKEYGITHVTNYYPNSGHGLDADAEHMARAEELLHEYVYTYLDSVDK